MPCAWLRRTTEARAYDGCAMQILRPQTCQFLDQGVFKSLENNGTAHVPVRSMKMCDMRKIHQRLVARC